MNITTDAERYRDALERVLRLIEVPSGYSLTNVRSAYQNDDEVWIYRYEKSSGENGGLGGEHYSFVVRKSDDKLLGSTWMDSRLSDGSLPNKTVTEETARRFLDRVAPGLAEQLEVLWIDRHDETITVNREGRRLSLTIPGMKYKCYSKVGDDYAWVVVGTGGSIVTFEQGIKWVNGRVTEKWLHDGWLEG